MGLFRQPPPEPAPRQMRGAAGGPGEAIDAATEDASSIIDLAESAALSILKDAEQHARRYLSVTKETADDLTRERAEVVSASSDSLLRHAEAADSESQELLDVIERARRRLAGWDSS